MRLTLSEYRDKVMGCWAGKNIGGVLGAPFEAKRQYNEVTFYQQDLSKGPPPNDDLDLQLIWLSAVERYGRQVNADILGEYWLSYVIPNWVEYGTGKANLRAGMAPPMSGYIDNPYRDSCGCFIRSELWACLAPGHPEIAARYAYEDGIVDHAGPGVHAEVFSAAMQSAAFVENDRDTLLNIGLSYIPEDSAAALAVRTAQACYRDGVPFREAIARVHDAVPGSFGVQNVSREEGRKRSDAMGMQHVGEPGFDAAENVGFTILAWLYGDGFGDSLCKAVACGEDTDCTAATLGALMGIMGGASSLPGEWTAPLNDKIATVCIDRTSNGIWVPDTVTELAERVMRVMPQFLGAELVDVLNPEGYTIECKSGDALYSPVHDFQSGMNGGAKDHDLPVPALCALPPHVLRKAFPTFSATLDLGGLPILSNGETRVMRLTIKNDIAMLQQQWVRVRLYASDGVLLDGDTCVQLPLNNLFGASASCVFTVNLDACREPVAEVLADISLVGRHSTGTVKAVLTRGSYTPTA